MSAIVVGVDQSDTARRAAETAAALATDTGSALHVVYCVKAGSAETVGVGSDRVTVDPDAEADAYISGLIRSLSHDDVTSHVEHGDPADVMCELADRLGARIIVVGNKRVQGASRVLGSVASRVTRSAPCDVLVAHTADH